MAAPRFVLVELGEYEKCLAEARKHYRIARDARSAPEREAALRAYAAAIAQARVKGGRLRQELDAAARAA